MDDYNNSVKNMAKTHHNNTGNFGGNSNYGGYRQDTHVNNSLSHSDSIVNFTYKYFRFLIPYKNFQNLKMEESEEQNY